MIPGWPEEHARYERALAILVPATKIAGVAFAALAIYLFGVKLT